MNRFRTDTQKPIPVLRMSPQLERAQVERLRHLRATRDPAAAAAALEALERAAASSGSQPAVRQRLSRANATSPVSISAWFWAPSAKDTGS